MAAFVEWMNCRMHLKTECHWFEETTLKISCELVCFIFSTYQYVYVSLMDSVFEWTWSISGNCFYCYSEKPFPLHLYTSKPKRTICSLVVFLCQDEVAEKVTISSRCIFSDPGDYFMGYSLFSGYKISELVSVTSVSAFRLPKHFAVATESPVNFVCPSLTFHFGTLFLFSDNWSCMFIICRRARENSGYFLP